MIGLYLHIPYCTVRCSYCDFYLVAGRRRDPGRFAAPLIAEMAAAVPAEPLTGRRDLTADTLHCGGGTPSILPPATLAEFVAAARRSFALGGTAEIALEANPEDVTPGVVAAWRSAGFNRVSLGVQALDDAVLRDLRRPHTAAQAIDAVRTARREGMPAVAVDLILGLAGRTTADVVRDIERVAEAGADHVSVYLLEIHPRTRLGRAVALGRARPAGDDEAAAQYEGAAAALERLGFEPYEISNFARPGRRSRHNLKYWTDEEYLGFGPAAHSYLDGRRWSNAPDLADYLERGGREVRRIVEPHRPDHRALEALVAGLRLVEGIDLERARRRHGPLIPAADDARIATLAGQGLLEMQGGRLRLTRRGRLVSNEVFERLWPLS